MGLPGISWSTVGIGAALWMVAAAWTALMIHSSRCIKPAAAERAKATAPHQ